MILGQFSSLDVFEGETEWKHQTKQGSEKVFRRNIVFMGFVDDCMKTTRPILYHTTNAVC